MMYCGIAKSSKNTRAGKIPNEIQEVWKVLVMARDSALDLLRKKAKNTVTTYKSRSRVIGGNND